MVRIDEETEPRRRHRHRRQRPLRQARPVHGRAARAGRGVPQRRRHRRQAARRLRLPELRLARGPGRHVAVRRGHPRSRRRLPGAGHPGDRRQRLALQPDRRDGDPPDAGRRRARRHRRRRPAARRSPSRTRASSSTCSATPTRSSAARPGPQVVHDHLGGLPPEGRPGARAAARRDPDLRLPRRHDRRRARPLRRRSDPGARRVLPARRQGCPARRAGRSRPVRLPLLRVGGPRGRRRPAQRGAPLQRHVRGAGPAGHPDRCRGRRRDRGPGRSSASR